MRILTPLLGCACVATAARASILTGDPNYVVQIHSSRDAFVPPVDADAPLRTQLMTTQSGDRFECFLPSPPHDLRGNDADNSHKAPSSTGEDIAADQLKFSRAAATKIRPKCLQYEDAREKSVYEICPSVLVRKIRLGIKADSIEEGDMKKPAKKSYNEIHELASYDSDRVDQAIAFDQFTGDTEDRLETTREAVYTQIFEPRTSAEEAVDTVKVQFLCHAAARDDFIAAVQWRQDVDNVREPASFLVVSRVFCNPRHSSGANVDSFTVSSLLRPLKEQRACIKRNEGWWTYEFCFGQGIRQYHRESDGKISAEFSLGQYDAKQNQELEATGGALVTDHIDATHDATRPAFLENYSGGSKCKEFDYVTPRTAKVLYYCSQGSVNHLILSVKETQTCAYTIKISTPVVCDHPHFISEEQPTERKPTVIHCVPTSESTLATVPRSTSAPLGAAEAVREVEVLAT